MISLARTPSSIATRVCCGRQRTARRRSSRASRRERRIGFWIVCHSLWMANRFPVPERNLAAMKLGVHVGYWGLGLASDHQKEIVQEAEPLGYDSVGTAEAYGSDAATILGWIAQATSTIRLGSGCFPRPPPGGGRAP